MPRKTQYHYTIVEDNNVIFSGTSADAVEKGYAKSKHSFAVTLNCKKHTADNEAIGRKIIITKKPFDEGCMQNIDSPICLLNAACNLYAQGYDNPCCKFCAHSSGCRDRCRNAINKCGCIKKEE